MLIITFVLQKECGFGLEEGKHSEQSNVTTTIISRSIEINNCNMHAGKLEKLCDLPKLRHSPFFDSLFGNDLGGWSDVMQSSLQKKQEKEEKKYLMQTY